MWLASGGAIRAHWTNQIHEEWIRNVARDYRITRSVLQGVRELMDHAAGDALIGRFRQHERLFPKTHAKDRHVAAAAIAARKLSRANGVIIATWNLKDFDRKELAQAGLSAESPETFLCRLLASSPEGTVAAFLRMRDNLSNPRKTIRECAETLAAQGLIRFAAAITTALK